MRRALLVSLVTLASCDRYDDTFTVNDPDGLAKSAVLQLDGEDQPLERDDRRFSTTRRIRRDADGRIRVVYADGRTVDCPIGYVTPGVGRRWNFRLTRSGCEPL